MVVKVIEDPYVKGASCVRLIYMRYSVELRTRSVPESVGMSVFHEIDGSAIVFDT